MTYTPHQRPDGTPDYERMLAQASLDMHPIGNALSACATHLAAIRELLPKRGELVDEFLQLAAALAYLEHTYQQADQTITSMALSAYNNAPDECAP